MKPILIVTDNCPSCNMIKKYIEDHGLQSDVDILNASDPEDMAEIAFMELAEKSAPLLVFPTVLRNPSAILAYLEVRD